MHFILQGLFVVFGSISLLAAILDWDWFFTSRNTQYLVSRYGRTKARICYALLGLGLICTAVWFFIQVIQVMGKSL